jgi:crotonobetainyl-CoA:carnitine CoA-transferase CaiB-like acyl-CoA transferase
MRCPLLTQSGHEQLRIKTEMLVNLKRALGITLLLALLGRADVVIE